MKDGTADPTDEMLVEAFRRGDEEGFRELVRRHRRTVYRLAWRAAGNHADADDLSQEVFLRVYRSLSGFRGDSTFRTWLYRIALNRLATWRRAAARAAPEAAMGREPAAPGRASDRLFRNEERERMRRAVRQLPERQRNTVILRFYEGMKYREIAQVLGCSEGTAKANVFHAVRALRARLGEEEERGGRKAVPDLP